jgi:hypothetical protein
LFLSWDEEASPESASEIIKARLWFRNQIKRLQQVKVTYQNVQSNEIPQYQRDTIWKFTDANIMAMEMALKSLEAEDLSEYDNYDDNGEDEEVSARDDEL